MTMKLRLYLIPFLLICDMGAVHAQAIDTLKPRRFEIRFGVGLSIAKTVSDYKAFLTQNGFSVYDYYDLYSSDSYTSAVKGSGMSAIVQYYPKPEYAFGVAFASLGSLIGSPSKVQGDKYMDRSSMSWVYFGEEHISKGFFLVASYVPVRVINAFSDFSLCLTAGLGINNIVVTYSASEYLDQSDQGNSLNIHMNPFGLYALASMNQEVAARVTVGIFLEYRFIPTRTIRAFTLPVPIHPYKGSDFIYDLQLPLHSINFSDWKIGLITGFRF